MPTIVTPVLELNLTAFTGLELFGYPVTVAVDTPKNPAVDTLALAGQVPNVLRADTYTPPVVTVTLSGKTPLVGTDRIATPGVGSLALTGYPTGGVFIDVPPLELNLVTFRGLQLLGHAPDVETTSGNIVDAPGRLRLNLTGKAPFSVSDPHTALPTKGTLTLASTAPTVLDRLPGPVVEPPALELNMIVFRGLELFGYPVSLAYGSSPVIEPSRLQLNLSLFTPTVIQPEVIPPSGAVLLEGKSLALGITDLTPEPSLELLGYLPAAFNSSPLFKPPVGALVLDPKEHITDVVSEPDIDALALSGQSVTVEFSDNAVPAPAAGSLTLTTIDPEAFTVPRPEHAELDILGYSVTLDYSLAATTGALSLATQAPTAVFGLNPVIQPAAYNVSLSTGTPFVIFGPVIRVAEANLTLSSDTFLALREESTSVPALELNLLGVAPFAEVVTYAFTETRFMFLQTYQPKIREKKVKRNSARTGLVSLTERRTLEQLYR